MDCKIRRWRNEDAEDLTKAINNKKILDNLRDGLPYPYTIEDARQFIHSMLEADENSTFAFAITVEDKAIGSIGIFRQDNIHWCSGELGYYIAEPYWHQGIMTQAVKQACQYVFTNTDIKRIFAEPFACNTASCRVLEKCGFVYEGTLRNNAIKNGQLLDMKMYAFIKEE